jgi:hypothetical protein
MDINKNGFTHNGPIIHATNLTISMLIEMIKLTKFEMTKMTKLLINVMGLFF